jgi:hypothetical protein
MTAETAIIGTLLEHDPYLDYPYEAFQKNTDEAWQKVPGLKPYAAKRYADILSILENNNIDCTVSAEMPHQSQNPLQLYPIPAADWVNIGNFPNQEMTVSITNIGGQVVMGATLFENGKLNISSLPSGCYVVKVEADRKVYSKLLLVSQ